MIELEKTYLIKEIPENINGCKFKEIIDVYFPRSSEHPSLRLRKQGNKFELTKKEPLNKEDASEQEEQTIILTEKEFEILNNLDGKRVRKFRYYLNFNDKIAEIDVFKDELEGLIVVDFEFNNVEEKNSFEIPNFCLADITQEVFIAGGMICGKKYEDIETELNRFGYQKKFINFK